MTTREPSRPVDEFDLELLEAGADVDPEVRAALAAEGFGPARDEIAKVRGWWATHRPPLPNEAPRRRPWRWVAPLVAIAAAALLVVAWPRDPGFQARGVPQVDLWRTHDGAPIEQTAPFRGGDQLGLALVVDQSRFVSVVTLQDDGGVSPLVVGQEVRGGSRFELPGRIALDDYPGREWLIVVATPEPPTEDQLTDAVDGLLPEPAAGPGRWVVEVTRGTAR